MDGMNPEADDYLHNPDPRRDRKVRLRRWGGEDSGADDVSSIVNSFSLDVAHTLGSIFCSATRSHVGMICYSGLCSSIIPSLP
jgi:hypothetical protein